MSRLYELYCKLETMEEVPKSKRDLAYELALNALLLDIAELEPTA